MHSNALGSGEFQWKRNTTPVSRPTLELPGGEIVTAPRVTGLLGIIGTAVSLNGLERSDRQFSDFGVGIQGRIPSG